MAITVLTKVIVSNQEFAADPDLIKLEFDENLLARARECVSFMRTHNVAKLSLRNVFSETLFEDIEKDGPEEAAGKKTVDYGGETFVEFEPECALASYDFAEVNEDGDIWAVFPFKNTRGELRCEVGNLADLEVAFSAFSSSIDAPASTLDGTFSKLKALKAEGLTIGECISAFAVKNEDPYVMAARSLVNGSDDHEIDDKTTTSPGENGAWVLTWLWVSDEEAGVLPHPELLEQVLEHARVALDGEHGLSPEIEQLRQNQADWLEDLVTNYSDELDEIATVVPVGLPGPITWMCAEGKTVRFMPSDALVQLSLLAARGGLPDNLREQAAAFHRHYGNKLDAILTVIQTGDLLDA